MTAYVAVVAAFFKVVEWFLGRIDEKRRADLIKLGLDALKVKADDETISRAVAAFDAPVVGPNGMHGDPSDYRD